MSQRALACSVLAAVASGAAAATYFVSSSNPAASDSNAGTKPSAPWRSLSRVSAASLVAGDVVVLRTGDVWTLTEGPWTLDGLVNVTLGAYTDAGAGAGNRPLVQKAGNATYGPVILARDTRGLAVTGLEVAHGEQGIVFLYSAAGTYAGMSVTDCFFHDIVSHTYNASTGADWGIPVALAANVSGALVANSTVAYNLFNASDRMYSNGVDNWPGTTRAYVSGMDMRANTVTHCSYNNVLMDTTDHFVMTGNVFANNTPANLFLFGTTDIIVGTVDGTCAIQGNEILYRGEYPGGPDGCAIDAETAPHGLRVLDNYILGSYGAGFMVFGHGDPVTPKNLSIVGNTFLYDGCQQTRDDHGGIAFMRVNSTGTLANNTFKSCPGTPALFVRIPGADAGWSIEGNVIDGQNGTVAVVAAPTVTVTASTTALLVSASSNAAGATLRYTVDGSRPTAASPVWPAAGLSLPARTTAVWVKAFQAGLVESQAVGGIYAPQAQ